MSKDLQIIKELKNKFGSFYYKIHNNEVIELEINRSSFKMVDVDLKLIGELTNLQKLTLECNQITKIEGLDKLTKLQELDLAYNLYITEIKGLNKLTNLQVLNLDYNKITEIKGLNKLTNLEILNLDYNKITETQGLDKLTNLRELDLEGNYITEIEGLEGLNNLKVIRIAHQKDYD